MTQIISQRRTNDYRDRLDMTVSMNMADLGIGAPSHARLRKGEKVTTPASSDSPALSPAVVTTASKRSSDALSMPGTSVGPCWHNVRDGKSVSSAGAGLGGQGVETGLPRASRSKNNYLRRYGKRHDLQRPREAGRRTSRARVGHRPIPLLYTGVWGGRG